MSEQRHAVFADPDSLRLLGGLQHAWIADAEPAGATGTIAQVDPANGDKLGVFDESGPALVDQAVAAARAAFAAGWGRTTAAERKTLLGRFADRIEANLDALAMLETFEVGRPISTARGVLAGAPNLVREQIALIDRMQGDLAGADDRRMAVGWRRPRGVVAAITPWNFPSMNVLMRLAPALAAGNAVVIKPSEYSPRSALLLARLAAEAGLPAGAVNVVPGSGAVTGRALAAHRDIDVITFTGSTATGQHIAGAAAANSLKPVLLECGGKSPQIVLDDLIDDPGIWGPIFFAAFWNSGQWCVARTRLLVPRDKLDVALAGLNAAARAWLLDDPQLLATRLGPLASPQQQQRVEQYLELASREGELHALDAPRGDLHPRGCYVAPHAVVVTDRAARIVREEIFGPVIAMQPFDTLDEALELANASTYGLAATVWTGDAKRGYRFARHLEAGLIDVISSSDYVADLVPGRSYEPPRPVRIRRRRQLARSARLYAGAIRHLPELMR